MVQNKKQKQSMQTRSQKINKLHSSQATGLPKNGLHTNKLITA